MTHDTARRLKAAGFHGTGAGHYYESHGDRLYFPTLSELIAACGKHLDSVERTNQERQVWRAVSADTSESLIGESAEDAVALLWLSLQANGRVGA